MGGTYCDKCNADIDTVYDRKTFDLDRDKDGRAITCDCFLCPECGEKYVILIHDKRTDNYIARMKREPEKSRELRQKVEKRQTELKKRYGFV